jgi:glycosyltransferase involved in cell wall biosynthesis
VYDHPNNPWCGGGGAGRTWAINLVLSRRHDITVVCGSFPNAKPQEKPFRVRFLGRSRKYIESRLKFIFLSRKTDIKPYDLIVEEFSYYAPIFSRFRGRPAVTILQGRHGLNAISFRGVYGFLSLISEYGLLPFRRSVIIVSEHLRSAVHRNAHVAVIGQGAHIPNNLPPSSEEYVLFLGRLDVWHKGLDILIKAWAKLPPESRLLPLDIAGGGDTEKIRALIKSTGAEDIKLVGRLKHHEALSKIKKAAFLCMPSRMEGSPLVLYEAFALGKPVIGSSIPALMNLIPHGIAGLQFPSGDADALSKAIEKLLVDRTMRSRLGEGANRLGKGYSWERVAESQEKFYWETIEGRLPGKQSS